MKNVHLMNNPCSPDCPLRFPSCQGKCPYGVQYREQRAKAREQEKRMRNEFNAILFLLTHGNGARKK